MKKKLYIIPSAISDAPVENYFPALHADILNSIDIYITENLRTARRFLRTAGFTGVFDDCEMIELDKHSKRNDFLDFLMKAGTDRPIGLLSEAGIPGIADPGADLVREAHLLDFDVIPLTGPSSIFLALAASGLNGQSFAFHGYLPIKDHDRNRKIKELEQIASKTGQTQIFIETPYRNQKMIDSLCSVCGPNISLCIAADVTGTKEFIKTMNISEWRSHKPSIHKIPAVFLLGV